jgi:hypothetical protein
MSSHYVEYLFEHPKAGEERETAFVELKQEFKVLE